MTVLNHSVTPSESRGVKVGHFSALREPGFLTTVDVGIVLNAPFGHMLRRDQRVNIPLILWNQHAHDQEANNSLHRLRERNAWNGFAFVSNWQQQHFEKMFWVPPQKSRVMRNAVSPVFADCAGPVPWFACGEPPVLFYVSTPFRGLDVLLDAFPRIRAAVPGTRLRIYSSMSIYQVRPEDDQFAQLYDLARATDGVDYVGSVSQTRLAQELKGAAALAYPSTFAETFCTSAIEAMACGAAVFTTRFGALPETTGGHATMVDWQADKARLADDFAAIVSAGLLEMRNDPATAMSRRDERLRYIRENFLWPLRAKEWAAWLSQIEQEARPAASLELAIAKRRDQPASACGAVVLDVAEALAPAGGNAEVELLHVLVLARAPAPRRP